MKASFKYRLAAWVFGAILLTNCGGGETPVPPGPPEEEDPITHVTVPGAYGVKGGDKILLPSSQTSVFVSDNSFSFRILDPSTLSVVSLSGLPVRLKVGDRISLHYRLSKGGRTLESEVYENARILMINDRMVWIKKSDEIFFVVQHF